MSPYRAAEILHERARDLDRGGRWGRRRLAGRAAGELGVRHADLSHRRGVSGRARRRVETAADIENLCIDTVGGKPLCIKDFAVVERGPEPVFNVVTAEGVAAVLLYIRSEMFCL